MLHIFLREKLQKRVAKMLIFFWVAQNAKPKGNAKTWKPTTDRHCFLKMHVGEETSEGKTIVDGDDQIGTPPERHKYHYNCKQCS